jgi:hypothetical protein
VIVTSPQVFVSDSRQVIGSYMTVFSFSSAMLHNSPQRPLRLEFNDRQAECRRHFETEPRVDVEPRAIPLLGRPAGTT